MQVTHKSLVKQLKCDTEALALPKGRRVGQPGHDVARKYLTERLHEIGLIPFKGRQFDLCYDLPLRGTTKPHRFTNLVGVVPGRNRKLPPILLGAHYDSVIDAPCADDNATSVALNLAIAEAFVDRPLERDLIIALFDAEEPPYFLSDRMGSVRFHEDHCQGLEFAAVIVSDLIGHDLDLSDLKLGVPGLNLLFPHAKDIVFLMGSESDSLFPGIVEDAAHDSKGLRIFPTQSRYVGAVSDHYSFEKRGHPILFLSCAQGRYYHDPRDTMDWINFKKLARITGFVSRLIERIDDTPGDRSRKKVDPVDYEIRMIRKAVGPALPLVLKGLGIKMPETRKEMDQLIGALI